MKIKHILSILVLTILSVLSLTSCSGLKSVDSLYKDEGVTLPKNHIYENVELDTLADVIKNAGESELIYVFYGDATNFDSKSAITTIDIQARQFKVSKVYYLDAQVYSASGEKRAEVKNKVKINDPNYVPTIVAYKNNEVLFDLSKETDRQDFIGEEQGKLDYEQIAGFIFRDKCVKKDK